mmetsp:Transcript_45168/g.98705  ORF Transcript_45168/g.98705 Transcript_45168/m.98705 type:complete len:241 (+) Transcript_45168:37-759(+)
MAARGPAYSPLSNSLVEVELYAQHAAAANERLRKKLVTLGRPTLIRMFVWQEASLLSLTLDAWHRHAGEQGIHRATERYEEQATTHLKTARVDLETTQGRLAEVRRCNTDLREQLEQATAYADEIDQERQAAVDKERRLRERLAEAERSIKRIDRDRLGGIHEVLMRYEDKKNGSDGASNAGSWSAAELRATQAQLAEIAWRLERAGSSRGESPATSHLYRTPVATSGYPAARSLDWYGR